MSYADRHKSYFSDGEPVNGTTNPGGAPVEYMRINHCGFHVFVAQEFLNGPDVVARLQEVSGEGVSRG